MAENKPNPDWRQTNKRAAGAPAAGGGKRDWQKQSVAASGPRKPWSRGSKLGVAVLLLSLFVGGVYIVIEWIRPVSPACLVLMGASYDVNLAIPENVYGWKNLDDLDKLKDEPGLYSESGKPNLLHRSPPLKGAEIWKKEWDIFSRKIREKTVVLFLALHGAADAKEPYFFLDDDNGYARLPFSEALQSLESSSLADKNIVLIIEPAQKRANWSAGVLENNFVAKLLELKPKLKPNVFILCASDANQVSWPSEEWQQTVFGHFVVEGLRGAADLDGNTRISAAELAKYVNQKVVAWSQANRGIEQTPIFIGDEARAADIEIAQVATRYQEKTGDAPGLNFTVPDGLESAWTTWQSLRGMTPHPAVYSPALWRRYQDLLVRYEQILRAGDPTKKSGEIAGKLMAMAKRLESEARFEAGDPTLSLTLPMPEALGVPLPFPEGELKKGVQKIWDAAKEEQRPEFFNDLANWAKAQPGYKSSLFRVQTYRAFLDFLCKSPLVRDVDLISRQADDPMSKTQALLDRIFDVKLGPPRPAEIHYLTMLLKDVSRNPAPDLDQLRQALLTRQLAERAALAVPDAGREHPYSEILLPWNREQIARADSQRRPGEDYLFGSTKDDWERARRYLDQAQNSYRASQKDSQAYRTALDRRDRGLAELPYYAQWVANQRVSATKEQSERVDDWSKKVTALAAQLDLLQNELFKEKGTPSLATLRELTTQVSDSFTKLQADVDTEVGNVNQDTHSHPLWFDREALLSVPPLLADQPGANAVETRLAMLRFNRVTSSRFFKSAEVPKTFGSAAKLDAEVSAKRNVQMALAACKCFWPLELTRVENESATAIGETLAALMKRWAPDINDALGQSFKEGDLAAAKATLRRGDFLSRGLPGGLEDRAEPMSASQALRSLRMSDLLMAQAQRTLVDHWYSEVPDAQPYYENAARGYLNVARQLIEVKGGTQDLNKLRLAGWQRLNDAVKTIGLDIDGKPADFWTSEKEFPVRWTIKTPSDPYLVDAKFADDAPPPAVAVTWRDLEGPGAWKDAGEPGQRRPIELLTNQKRDFPETYFLTKSNADDAALKATYNVLLRGQRKSGKIEVSRKDPDLIVHDFPKPAKSFIKVRMDPKFTYGAVSIAFDISGSMIWGGRYLIDTPDGKKTRMELALNALDTTLKIIPENTYVSLIAFVTKDGQKSPEIIDVLKPAPWSRDKAEGVLSRLKDLSDQAWKDVPQAYGSTPMAYTLVKCWERGFPTAAMNFRGPKVILGLSDGDDTSTFEMLRVPLPPNFPPKAYNKKVADYLTDELGNKDVEVHFVGFIDKNKFPQDAANAESQFGVVQEFKNPGRLVLQPDPVLLAKELEKAIRPRLIMEQGTATPPGYHPEGEFASLPKDESNWIPVPEGQYTVRVKGSPPRDLKLNPGDMIAIALKRDPLDPKKIIYEREMFADLIADTVPLLGEAPAMGGRYRVAVMQNQPTAKTNLLTQLVDVEEASKANRLIQQSVPRFTWIESKPKNPQQPSPRMMRWYREFGYPALTYRIHGYDWPFPAAVAATPEVNVWLTDTPDSEAFAKPLERSLKKTKVDVVRLDADQFATVEDVTIEEKEIAPDSHGKVGARLVPKQCLVVRVEHAKGRPVFIQFNGAHKGEEHHYFHSANKYTAMFWDLTNPNQETLSFNVIFLDALKRETPPATFTISGRNSNFPSPYPMGN